MRSDTHEAHEVFSLPGAGTGPEWFGSLLYFNQLYCIPRTLQFELPL